MLGDNLNTGRDSLSTFIAFSYFFHSVESTHQNNAYKIKVESKPSAIVHGFVGAWLV